MSFEKRDFYHGGPNFYMTCYDWDEVEYTPLGQATETTCFEAIFKSGTNGTRLTSLFSHLYFKYKTLDDEGEEIETIGDCGIELDKLLEDFLALYGERPMVKKFYPKDLEKATPRSINQMAAILAAVLDLNEFKYRKLSQTLGLSYNPIENYAMLENEAIGQIEEGKETLDHSVDSSQVGMMEAVGPLSQLTATQPDPTTGIKSFDMVFDISKKIETNIDTVSDTELGKKTGGTSASPSVADGTQQRQDQYTTTMDDSSTGRLEGYTTASGTTATATKGSSKIDDPVYGRMQSGAPNAPSYTDTREINDKTKEVARELSRNGNIGVMSSQQMIEQERQIVRFSLLKEFFDDLEKVLLLNCY